MANVDRRCERTAALAMLGAVLFHQPLLGAFDKGADGMLAGIPILFLYIFLAWGVLILLLGLVMARFRSDTRRPPARGTGLGVDRRS